jgi:hypothetical protein
VKPVWLFLVTGRALPGNDMFTVGSEASLQCFVPGHTIEHALKLLDEFLAGERYERIDLTIARRYDVADPEEEYPSDYVRKDMESVEETQHCVIGIVVYSRDTGTLRIEES